jgi:dTDP-4-amino-4,6-dideoxygalactose transaminase
MPVPFYDMSAMHRPLQEELMAGFNQITQTGHFILGHYVQQFEDAFAKYCGSDYCIGTGNGLDALTLALEALNIGPGHEVIVPANTFIATWIAITRAGATPIPVEPKADTYNLNPSLIADKITPRTKAIIAVHLYGQSAEMDAINSIAAKHGLYVVEDFAQAQGATWLGKPCGSMGIINATSFYPGKNIGAFGDAGAITTSSKELHERACLLRNYGSPKKYIHSEIGYNSRLDEIQALVLQIKLKHLNRWNEERRAIAQKYTTALQGVGDLTFQALAKNATSVYHQFIISTAYRNKLQQHLTANGIGTIIHYPVPPHLQPAYSQLGYAKGSLPVTEQMANSVLSLPMYPGLTDECIAEVCQAIKQFYQSL